MDESEQLADATQKLREATKVLNEMEAEHTKLTSKAPIITNVNELWKWAAVIISLASIFFTMKTKIDQIQIRNDLQDLKDVQILEKIDETDGEVEKLDSVQRAQNEFNIEYSLNQKHIIESLRSVVEELKEIRNHQAQ